MGWWKDSATEEDKEYLLKYLDTNGKDIAWLFIRSAFSSVSQTAIVLMQVTHPHPPPAVWHSCRSATVCASCALALALQGWILKFEILFLQRDGHKARWCLLVDVPTLPHASQDTKYEQKCWSSLTVSRLEAV